MIILINVIQEKYPIYQTLTMAFKIGPADQTGSIGSRHPAQLILSEKIQENRDKSFA